MYQVEFIWKGRSLCNRVYDIEEPLAALRKARELQTRLAITMTKASRQDDKRAKPIEPGSIELRLSIYSPQIELWETAK